MPSSDTSAGGSGGMRRWDSATSSTRRVVRRLKLPEDSAKVKVSEAPVAYCRKGLEGGGGKMRLEAKGKKCWRVRERECLSLGRMVRVK